MSRSGNNSRYNGVPTNNRLSTDFVSKACEVRGRSEKIRLTNRIVKLAAVAAGATIALFGCSDNDSSPVETPKTTCVVSPETTNYTVRNNDGADTIALQVNGADYGTCFETTKNAIQAMNEGFDITRPAVGDSINIPQSVTAVTATTQG